MVGGGEMAAAARVAAGGSCGGAMVNNLSVVTINAARMGGALAAKRLAA